MKKNKIISIIIIIILFAGFFSSCANKEDETSVSQKSEGENEISEKQLSVVSTIFPQYDWARQILGEDNENIDLTLLVDKGVDLHNFQPSADDIVKISSCDMFLYVGGESDAWVDDILNTAVGNGTVVINLLDVIGDEVKQEEQKEGMEHSHDHEDEEEHGHEDEEEHEEHAEEEEHGESEVDEHVWLSFNHAEVICNYIADELSKMDQQNADAYHENAQKYIDELRTMDQKYQDVVENASFDILLFGDRFPFRYLVDDYGLDYYAAFSGCSAETEASFETIAFLAGKVDEENLGYIVTIDSSNQSLAETIKENTSGKNQEIIALDSMQSVTGEDIKNGVTYLSIMEKNLAVLEQALN